MMYINLKLITFLREDISKGSFFAWSKGLEIVLHRHLDPVGSTVRYELMKLCTGSIYDSNIWYLVVLRQYKAVSVNS